LYEKTKKENIKEREKNKAFVIHSKRLQLFYLYSEVKKSGLGNAVTVIQ